MMLIVRTAHTAPLSGVFALAMGQAFPPAPALNSHDALMPSLVPSLDDCFCPNGSWHPVQSLESTNTIHIKVGSISMVFASIC